jgi:hypothetical protein
LKAMNLGSVIMRYRQSFCVITLADLGFSGFLASCCDHQDGSH